MPYKSDAQRRYFNANREKLQAQGVDVDEWNESSKGKKLPKRAPQKKPSKGQQKQSWLAGPDVGTMTYEEDLHNALQAAEDAGGDLLTPEITKQLRNSLGYRWWHRDPDELAAVEALMEQEDAQQRAMQQKQAVSNLALGVLKNVTARPEYGSVLGDEARMSTVKVAQNARQNDREGVFGVKIGSCAPFRTQGGRLGADSGYRSGYRADSAELFDLTRLSTMKLAKYVTKTALPTSHNLPAQPSGLWRPQNAHYLGDSSNVGSMTAQGSVPDMQAAMQQFLPGPAAVQQASTLNSEQSGMGGGSPSTSPISHYSGLGTNPGSMSSYTGNAAFGTQNASGGIG